MNRVLSLLTIVLLLIACRGNQSSLGPNEGLVRYQIEYPPEITSQPIASLLPGEMDMLFKGGFLKIKISGDYNLFALEFLSKNNGDSCFTFFKVFNKKLAYQLAPSERWFFFDHGPTPTPRLIPDSVKQIAGLECWLVELTYPADPTTKVHAYYTNALNIDSKLLRNPLGKIDGIPLQFEVKYNAMVYRFTAVSILPFPENEQMWLPTDFELTTQKEIRSLIDSVLN